MTSISWNVASARIKNIGDKRIAHRADIDANMTEAFSFKIYLTRTGNQGENNSDIVLQNTALILLFILCDNTASASIRICRESHHHDMNSSKFLAFVHLPLVYLILITYSHFDENDPE